MGSRSGDQGRIKLTAKHEDKERVREILRQSRLRRMLQQQQQRREQARLAAKRRTPERRKPVEHKKRVDARKPRDPSNREARKRVQQKKDTQKVRQQSGEEPERDRQRLGLPLSLHRLSLDQQGSKGLESTFNRLSGFLMQQRRERARLAAQVRLQSERTRMSPKLRGRGERRNLVEHKKGNDARKPRDASNPKARERLQQKKDTQKFFRRIPLDQQGPNLVLRRIPLDQQGPNLEILRLSPPRDASNPKARERLQQKKDTQKVRQQSGEETKPLKPADEHGTQDASLKERTRQHGRHEASKKPLDKGPEQVAIARSEAGRPVDASNRNTSERVQQKDALKSSVVNEQMLGWLEQSTSPRESQTIKEMALEDARVSIQTQKSMQRDRQSTSPLDEAEVKESASKDGAKAEDLKDFEKRYLHSHWISPKERELWARSYLEAYFQTRNPRDPEKGDLIYLILSDLDHKEQAIEEQEIRQFAQELEREYKERQASQSALAAGDYTKVDPKFVFEGRDLEEWEEFDRTKNQTWSSGKDFKVQKFTRYIRQGREVPREELTEQGKAESKWRKFKRYLEGGELSREELDKHGKAESNWRKFANPDKGLYVEALHVKSKNGEDVAMENWYRLPPGEGAKRWIKDHLTPDEVAEQLLMAMDAQALATQIGPGRSRVPPRLGPLPARSKVAPRTKPRQRDMRKVRSRAEIGREAHRQVLRNKYGKLAHEVTLELEPGVFVVRKDALRIRKQGAQVIIIKPNTPTGRAAAQRRERLMQRYGYDTKIEYYDPKDPAYLPDSKTYIGE